MACVSCGTPHNTNPTVQTLHFQATPDRMQEMLAWYARLATLAAKQLPDKAPTPSVVPPMVILTLVGCTTQPTKKEVKQWIDDAYTGISSFFEADTDKGAYDKTSPMRLVMSWDGTTLGFRFEDNCARILNVVLFPQICPLAGIEINTYCVELDQWKTYTDGHCGQYYQLVKTNSEECGYIPPIPAGEKLETYCEDLDQWAYFSDGNYGKTPVLIHVNSLECGYVPPPAAGTVLDTFCRGEDSYATIADGSGGSSAVLQEANSADCGYEPAPPPPAAGEKVGQECRGVNLWYQYTDGSGGTKWELYENNSPQCGYTPPPTPPAGGVMVGQECRGVNLWYQYTDGYGGTRWELYLNNATECGYTPPVTPTNPAYGTLLSTYCTGYTNMGKYANGSGGSYDQVIEANSPTCGYTPPVVPVLVRTLPVYQATAPYGYGNIQTNWSLLSDRSATVSVDGNYTVTSITLSSVSPGTQVLEYKLGVQSSGWLSSQWGDLPPNSGGFSTTSKPNIPKNLWEDSGLGVVLLEYQEMGGG